MNRFPDKATVERVRAMYPPGSRVELFEMNNPFSSLKPGDMGTVEFVDDAAGIHIRWDNGSSLAAIWGVDCVKIL